VPAGRARDAPGGDAVSLTETQRWHIREKWKAGGDPSDLAREYGVSPSEIDHEIRTFRAAIESRQAGAQATATARARPQEPTRGLRCQVCGAANEYGSGTPSLVPGFVLARCQGRCAKQTPHRPIGEHDTRPVAIEGDRRKERGMGLVALTDPGWRDAAIAEIRRLAESGRDFTADDLTAKVGVPGHMNAIGPVFASASRRGIIEQVGWRKAAGRASQQSRRLAVWRGRSTP
jgi:hypothetical protein